MDGCEDVGMEDVGNDFSQMIAEVCADDCRKILYVNILIGGEVTG